MIPRMIGWRGVWPFNPPPRPPHPSHRLKTKDGSKFCTLCGGTDENGDVHLVYECKGTKCRADYYDQDHRMFCNCSFFASVRCVIRKIKEDWKNG